uniref:Uncharacterized protein n=1 Tax=Arundo donax TaxID=35708 RepID=A0A0A9AEL2_ARUDO
MQAHKTHQKLDWEETMSELSENLYCLTQSVTCSMMEG